MSRGMRPINSALWTPSAGCIRLLNRLDKAIPGLCFSPSICRTSRNTGRSLRLREGDLVSCIYWRHSALPMAPTCSAQPRRKTAPYCIRALPMTSLTAVRGGDCRRVSTYRSPIMSLFDPTINSNHSRPLLPSSRAWAALAMEHVQASSRRFRNIRRQLCSLCNDGRFWVPTCWGVR
jgi:hypothetical protein